MMTNSTPQIKWKYALALPLLAAVMFMTSCKKEQVMNQPVAKEEAKAAEKSTLEVKEVKEDDKVRSPLQNDTKNEGLKIVALAQDPEKVQPPKSFKVKNEIKEQKEKLTQDDVFRVVEQMPRFPGCEDMVGTPKEAGDCADQEMLKFMYTNIVYPKVARDKGLQGMVVATFIVEKDGSISGAKLLRDIGDGCGDEVLRVVKMMNDMPQKWIPGKQRGEAVRVQFNLPIKFRLQSADDDKLIQKFKELGN